MGYWNTVHHDHTAASINDACRVLNVCRRGLRRLIADGQLTTRQVGKRLVVIVGGEA